MAKRKKKEEAVEEVKEPAYKDFEFFTKEVEEALKENRVIKTKDGWRVFKKLG